MADVIFNAFKKNVGKALIDLESDTIKAMLVTSAYTPDKDSHEFKSDVTNEVVGEGYVAGGKVLANKAVTQDNVNDLMKFDADDPEWADSTITARRAILYKDTGDPATSPLIVCQDFGSDKSSESGLFKVQFDALGILRLKEV